MKRLKFNRVFICYSRADAEHAEPLFRFFKANGFRVFLDTLHIRPGDDWEPKTLEFLRETNFLIILLSRQSIEQRGYNEKEYKLSIDYYDRMDNPHLCIMPVRIDNCDPPASLSRFQWTENTILGRERMLEAMHTQIQNWEQENAVPRNKLWRQIAAGILAFALLIFFAWLFAHEKKIETSAQNKLKYTATLFDAANNRPVPGGFAYLVGKDGDTLVKSEATGNDGRLELWMDSANQFAVRIHFRASGYQDESRIIELRDRNRDDTLKLLRASSFQKARHLFFVHDFVLTDSEQQMIYDSTGYLWDSGAETVFHFSYNLLAVRCISGQGCRFAGSAVQMTSRICSSETGIYLAADDGIARDRAMVESEIRQKLFAGLNSSRKKILHKLIACLSAN